MRGWFSETSRNKREENRVWIKSGSGLGRGQVSVAMDKSVSEIHWDGGWDANFTVTLPTSGAVRVDTKQSLRWLQSSNLGWEAKWHGSWTTRQGMNWFPLSLPGCQCDVGYTERKRLPQRIVRSQRWVGCKSAHHKIPHQVRGQYFSSVSYFLNLPTFSFGI